ncbi:MAG TPA: hypothetical protein VNU21_09570 [Usitatibacter sp.]|nr:hypothetical protein [Usitatibacter sp.]
MKNAITMTLLGVPLLAAGFAVAAVTKATFDVTFSDGTQGTIYVGSKTTNKAVFTQCDYEDVNGQFLGGFGSPDFASTDPAALEQFCQDHYVDRQLKK